MDISDQQLELVKKLLAQHLPGIEVRAFGSRINGTAKPHSDFDLALMTTEALAPETMALLKAAFSESDLPFKVDVLDWSTISDSFRDLIDNRYEIIP